MGGAGPFIKNGLLIILVLGLMSAGCSGGGTALKKDNPDTIAKLQKVEVKDGNDFTTVVAVFDKPVIHNAVRITDPPKLVVDLAGVELGENTSMMKVDKGLVSYITPSRVPNTKRLARLEIGLSADSDYRIVEDGGIINILFEKKKEDAKEEPKMDGAKPADAKIADASSPETAKAETDKTPAIEKDQKPAPVENTAAAAPAEQNASPAGAVDKAPEDKPAAAKAAEPKPDSSPAAKPQAEASTKELPAATRVDSIKCAKAGAAYQVTIAGNGRFVDPKVFMLGKDRLVVDLPGAGSVKEKETISVNGKYLKRVRMARHEGADKKVRVVLDIAGAVEYDTKADGKSLIMTVAAAGAGAVSKTADTPKTAPSGVVAKAEPAVRPAPAPAASVPAAKAPAADVSSAAGVIKAEATPVSGDKVQPLDLRDTQGVKVYVTKDSGKAVLSSAPISDSTGMTGEYVETPTKIYTGGKISFDIQDADLDKVIKLLADVAGLNLIIDPGDVKGKVVTLKLDNVPWDQALDILLKIYNLDKVLEGNVLRVAPKSKLDDEKKRELMLITEQKTLQEDAADLFTKTFKLDNATAADLEAKVKKILSKRGDATSNPRTNELIVTDVKENIEKAEKLIHILDKGVNQIMIEARIVEVDVTYSQSIGISWGLQGNGGNSTRTVVAQGSDQSLLLEAAKTLTDDLGNPTNAFVLAAPKELKSGAAGLAGNFSWAAIANELGVSLTIEALESIGKAETLSAPKVMTLENQAASIVNGSTIYVQSTTASGTAPLPLNANLSLTVTPRVTGTDYISLDVVATDNTPNLNPPAGSTAAINTKSVTTKVLVKDGNTIVLGGIYTRTNSVNDAEVPYLGRIPILGWLFRTRTVDRPTTELLIFITPKLVKQPGQV